MAKISAALTASLCVIIAGSFVLGSTQAQNQPTDDSVALTSLEETTVGRRLLMNSIGGHNDIVHDILDGALPMDDLELRTRLASISAMLYAFPSLYRAEPNPYSEEGEAADAARVSLANASVWEEFETFKVQAYDAYYKAQEAADAPPDQVLARVEELEVMCEGCHEVYRAPFEYIDFDNIEGMVAQ